MYIVTIISTLLIAHYVKETRCVGVVGIRSVPSSVYLPGFGNPLGKNNKMVKGGSDINTVLKKDFELVPWLGNGFQYQPIICRQCSGTPVEYPRYSQFVVGKLSQDSRSRNAPPIESVSISNRERLYELKPITNSVQLLPKVKEFNEVVVNPMHASWSSSLGFQRDVDDDDDRSRSISSFETPTKLPKQKTVTVNDRNSYTMSQRPHLRLTPPHRTVEVDDTIPCIERCFRRTENWVSEISLVDTDEKEETVRSKGKVLTGQRADIRPVFEIHNENHDREIEIEDNHYRGLDYQFRSKDYFERPTPRPDTYSDSPLVPQIPLETKKRCNYREAAGNLCNVRQGFPRNRVLALALSKHGVYLHRRSMEQPIYAHLALNNIHNSKPFGSYKLTVGFEEGEETKPQTR